MPVGERRRRGGACAGVTLSLAIVLLGAAMLSPTAAAQGGATRYALTGGAEYFSWREYHGNGDRLLEESGPRYFVGLEAETRMGNGWTYGFRGRVYSGEVNYDGQTTGAPPVVKVNTDTDYTGLAVALDFTHPLPAPAGPEVALRLGIGVDHWRRHILDTAAANGSEERYTIPAVTVGLVLQPEAVTGWHAQGGVKIPFATREEVSNFGPYDDLSLSPEPDFSLYADLGYRFNERWEAGIYYDSYRFKKSDAEMLTVGGARVDADGDGYLDAAYQPESRQDAWGLRLRYWF